MRRTLTAEALLLLFTASFAACAAPVDMSDADIERCAPGVDVETVAVLVRDLTGGEPYAVTPFGGETLPYVNPADAASVLAKPENTPKGGWLIGLAQVNSKRVKKMGMKPAEALDPCVNLRIASEELKGCFESKSVKGAKDKLKPLLRCFYASRVPEKDLAARVNTVVARVKPAVPSLSSLMEPAPEEPLVYSAGQSSKPLIF